MSEELSDAAKINMVKGILLEMNLPRPVIDLFDAQSREIDRLTKESDEWQDYLIELGHEANGYWITHIRFRKAAKKAMRCLRSENAELRAKMDGYERSTSELEARNVALRKRLADSAGKGE